MSTAIRAAPEPRIVSVERLARESIQLSVENIGGIDQSDLVVFSGVTALTDRNVTNRPSLLQAVMAVLGSDAVSLKGDADEDTIEHLSESEREVTGLVFALAGYLVHVLHETVPVMVLDSLDAVDADRIATLIEHVEANADDLLVALLPEDAVALHDDYQRITDI